MTMPARSGVNGRMMPADGSVSGLMIASASQAANRAEVGKASAPPARQSSISPRRMACTASAIAWAEAAQAVTWAVAARCSRYLAARAAVGLFSIILTTAVGRSL